jgi:hypothetical protein
MCVCVYIVLVEGSKMEGRENEGERGGETRGRSVWMGLGLFGPLAPARAYEF